MTSSRLTLGTFVLSAQVPAWSRTRRLALPLTARAAHGPVAAYLGHAAARKS